jgi:hypothetical protein
MFKERCYGIAELNNVLYRRLDREEKFAEPPEGCEIRRGVREEAETASAIVERAFFPDGAPEAFQGLLTPLYQMEGAVTFAATIEGKMAACGAGLIIPEHRVFAVCGAGTLAEFRGRGLQTCCCVPVWLQRPRWGANMPLWSPRAGRPRSAIASGSDFVWLIAR